MAEWLPVSVVAEECGVTTEGVRYWIRKKRVVAEKVDGRWQIELESYRRLRRKLPIRRSAGQDLASIKRQIEALRRSVDRLEQRDQASSSLITALERERDSYRSDLATLRTASVLVNASADETGEAIRALLTSLDLRSAALAQLLAPGTPDELELHRDSSGEAG